MWLESSVKEMACSKPKAKPDADELTKFIQGLKAKARLERTMQKLRDARAKEETQLDRVKREKKAQVARKRKGPRHVVIGFGSRSAPTTRATSHVMTRGKDKLS